MPPDIYATPPLGPEEAAALERLEQLRLRLRPYTAQRRRWVGSIRRVLAARAIQGSNSIEGHHLSVEDVLTAGDDEQPPDADRGDWLAVRGYQRAMTFVLQLADDPHYRLSGDMIRSLHFMMTEHDLGARPGLWRPGPIWIRSEVSGEVVYEGPDSGEVPALVDTLIARLDAERQVPPIIRAAMAHLNLVLIHPFSDGNGRMARALQTLILVRETGSVAEFASIEEYLGRNTQAYYDILARVGGGTWSPEADARPWVRFCLEAHFVQASSVLRRVQESEGIWQQLDELVTEAGLPPRTVHALFDAAIGLRVRNASYRAAIEHWGDSISPDTASADLRRMVAADLLTMVGERRWARYIASDRLTEIRERSQSSREPIDASDLFTPTGQLRLDG